MHCFEVILMKKKTVTHQMFKLLANGKRKFEIKKRRTKKFIIFLINEKEEL